MGIRKKRIRTQLQMQQQNARSIAWYRKNKTKAISQSRANVLKKKYGLTEQDYENILFFQGNCCAICKSSETGLEKAKRFCIDHCHTTGVIRGILCFNCNTGLGHFNDSIGLLEDAIKYLERPR